MEQAMDKLSRLSIEALYAQAASTAPAPGGGSVTALCGMLGVSLVLKALRITLRKAEDAELKAAEPELDRLARILAEDADADALSFDAYIAAVRLPRATPDEAKARAARLKAAAVQATQAALAARDHADEAIAHAKAIGGRLTSRLAPDLAAGLQLREAARANAIQNARDNLGAAEGTAEHAVLAQRLGPAATG
jgi:methenyltetrahydrofolate cyclohydrolase